jgi:hypothetical protein
MPKRDSQFLFQFNTKLGRTSHLDEFFFAQIISFRHGWGGNRIFSEVHQELFSARKKRKQKDFSGFIP